MQGVRDAHLADLRLTRYCHLTVTVRIEATKTIDGAMVYRENGFESLSPPLLALAKMFSGSGFGRIFPLFSGVMQDGLSTGPCARRPGSRLSESDSTVHETVQ